MGLIKEGYPSPLKPFGTKLVYFCLFSDISVLFSDRNVHVRKSCLSLEAVVVSIYQVYKNIQTYVDVDMMWDCCCKRKECEAVVLQLQNILNITTTALDINTRRALDENKLKTNSSQI